MGNKKKESLIQFNRDNIITAARTLFEKKGISATTVDDIAKEADCSKSTLYVYFKNKDEILNTILYVQMFILKEIINKCTLDFTDFKSCYLGICNELVKYQQRFPVYYDEMLGEIKITQQDMDEKTLLYDIYMLGEEINDLVKTLIQKGINSNFIREDIEIMPTVLYLWSGIYETIRFANRKQEYLKLRFDMDVNDYTDYGFMMLLKSITK